MSNYSTIKHLIEAYGTPIGDHFKHPHNELGYVLGAIQFDLRDPELQSHLEVCDVPVADLHPTQFEIDLPRLDQLPASDPDEHLPFVLDINGTLVISDGHHRTVRAMRRGDTKIRARVLHVKQIYIDDDLSPVIEY